MQHPLHQIAHLRVAERQRRALRHPVPGHEDTIGGVDPELLDLGIVEIALQRAEARDGCHDLPLHRALVAQQRKASAQGPLAVPPHLLAHVAFGERSIRPQIDAVATHTLANLLGDLHDGMRHPHIMRNSRRRLRRIIHSRGRAVHADACHTRTMDIDEWWTELEPSTRQWLIDNNGDEVPAEIIQEILDAGGVPSTGWLGDRDRDRAGFLLTDDAVDWIEAKANDEDPERA